MAVKGKHSWSVSWNPSLDRNVCMCVGGCGVLFHLAEEHFNMYTGAAGDWTANPVIIGAQCSSSWAVANVLANAEVRSIWKLMFLPMSQQFIWRVERDNSQVEDGQNDENAED